MPGRKRHSAPPPSTAESEKLHKVRRTPRWVRGARWRWIAGGRVSVNGVIDTRARVTDADKIVDGSRSNARASVARIVIMNKAEGVVCTRRDPEGGQCFDGLPRLTMAGGSSSRLINSSGLRFI
jgi:23S rRNA pseudouridine2605 synthase